MYADEYAYIGRDNIIKRQLLIDGNVLSTEDKAAITRVVVRVGSYCLDTGVGDNITFSDDIVSVQIGLIENIRRGMYNAEITVYDSVMVNGKAWDSFTVFVDNWDACDDS